MGDEEVNQNTPENKGFWENYRLKVLERGVSQDRLEWYERWANRFATSVRGVPIRARGPKYVDEFLRNLAAGPRVRDWQVAQAADALKILYQDLLNIPWADPGPVSLKGKDVEPAEYRRGFRFSA